MLEEHNSISSQKVFLIYMTDNIEFVYIRHGNVLYKQYYMFKDGFMKIKKLHSIVFTFLCLCGGHALPFYYSKNIYVVYQPQNKNRCNNISFI